jgi:hypothetical protein
MIKVTEERVSLRAPTCRGVAIPVEETVVDFVMQGFGLSGFSSLTGEDQWFPDNFNSFQSDLR